MNGYINKQDAIDVVQILQTKMSEEGSNALESVISAITDMAEADAVPVVRCKDCKWCVEHCDTDGNAPYWVCRIWDSGTDYDGYCYEAEKKVTE